MAINHDHHFVTVLINDQLFGLPVLSVQDVLYTPELTTVPLSSPEIAGFLNLRGRIVTALDTGVILGIEPSASKNHSMCVVLEDSGELYSLIVDRAGEVMSLDPDQFDKSPATLDPQWQDLISGVYRLKDRILVALDDKKIFSSLFKKTVVTEEVFE